MMLVRLKRTLIFGGLEPDLFRPVECSSRFNKYLNELVPHKQVD